MPKGVADGFEPEREVATVLDGGGIGPRGACTVEVVDRIESDAEPSEMWGEAVKPEADVATGAVQQQDSGSQAVLRGAFGFGQLRLNDLDGNGFAAALKSLHGR